MAILKRKIGILKRIEIDVRKKCLPTDECKSIRCRYCNLEFEDRCDNLIWCNIFNHPSSQYPPRKYAYVV